MGSYKKDIACVDCGRKQVIQKEHVLPQTPLQEIGTLILMSGEKHVDKCSKCGGRMETGTTKMSVS